MKRKATSYSLITLLLFLPTANAVTQLTPEIYNFFLQQCSQHYVTRFVDLKYNAGLDALDPNWLQTEVDPSYIQLLKCISSQEAAGSHFDITNGEFTPNDIRKRSVSENTRKAAGLFQFLQVSATECAQRKYSKIYVGDVIQQIYEQMDLDEDMKMNYHSLRNSSPRSSTVEKAFKESENGKYYPGLSRFIPEFSACCAVSQMWKPADGCIHNLAVSNRRTFFTVKDGKAIFTITPQGLEMIISRCSGLFVALSDSAKAIRTCMNPKHIATTSAYFGEKNKYPETIIPKDSKPSTSLKTPTLTQEKDAPGRPRRVFPISRPRIFEKGQSPSEIIGAPLAPKID